MNTEEKLKAGKRLSKLDAPKEILDEEEIMADDDHIISKTDLKGFITYCNDSFVKFAEWDHKDLIGANHNLIRHPDMPKIAFKIMWDLIQHKKEFFGFVKNLSKTGKYYWTLAYVTVDVDENVNIIGYTSFRKKPTRKAIEIMSFIYKSLVDAEKTGGMAASYKVLKETLEANDSNIIEKYNELVFSLEN
jgi:PAS domain S-box-containing protein